MIDRLLSYWNYGSKYCGLELTTKDQSDQWFALVAKKSRDEFLELETFEASDISAITTNLKKQQHCILTINTDQVLVKEVDSGKTLKAALTDAFPGLEIDSFYAELLQSGEKSWVSLCKKSYVDSILEECRQAKISVYEFHLGPTLITQALLALEEHQILCNRFSMVRNQQEILEMHTTSEHTTYALDDRELESSYLLSLGALLAYEVKLSIPSNYNGLQQSLQGTYVQSNRFRKTVGIAIVIALLTLLVNTFYFTSFQKEVNELEMVAAAKESHKSMHNKLNAAVLKKENIIENIFNNGNSRSSYFLNQLTHSKPATIQFDEIIFQPLQKSIREDKAILWKEDLIEVRGRSTVESEFTIWIQAIENQNWISEVIVLAYGGQNKETEDFHIEIRLKNDSKE